MKVVFIGGLTNGKIVYDYLKANKFVDLVLSITYSDDYKGARSVIFENSEKIIKSGTLKGYENLISEIQPDVIFVAGWSELIPDRILKIPPMGVIGFHPAKLPYNRGRSVLAWQIEEGCIETALTMFKYSAYPDGGNILAQETIKIDKDDYINDVLNKIDVATYNIMKAYFPLFRQNLIKERVQDLSEGNFRRLRGEKDSVINWNDTGLNIYNKIRAISKPYPGAMTQIDGKKIVVWRAKRLLDFPFGSDQPNGTLICKLYDGSLILKCIDGYIQITEYESI